MKRAEAAKKAHQEMATAARNWRVANERVEAILESVSEVSVTTESSDTQKVPRKMQMVDGVVEETAKEMGISPKTYQADQTLRHIHGPAVLSLSYQIPSSFS